MRIYTGGVEKNTRIVVVLASLLGIVTVIAEVSSQLIPSACLHTLC